MSIGLVAASSMYLDPGSGFLSEWNAIRQKYAVWIRLRRSSISGLSYMFGYRDDASGTKYAYLRFYGGTELHFGTSNSSDKLIAATSFNSTSVWYFIVAIQTGPLAYLYVDGASDATPADLGISAACGARYPYLGCFGYTPLANYLDAQIAEWAIFNGDGVDALTAAAIAQAHTNKWTPDHFPGLVSYHRFTPARSFSLGGAGLRDNSRNAYHMTPYNSPAAGANDPDQSPPPVHVRRHARSPLVHRWQDRNCVLGYHDHMLRHRGCPVPGLLEIRTDIEWVETSGSSWTARVVSTESPGPYWWYYRGRLIDVTSGPQRTFARRPDAVKTVEVHVRPGGHTARWFEDRLRFSWAGTTTALFYRVEELVGSVWTPRGQVLENGSQYYMWETAPLADDADYSWRVVAVDAEGEEAASDTISGRMVRVPSAVMARSKFSYDAGTQKVTVAS